MSGIDRFCAACSHALKQNPSPSQTKMESRLHHSSPVSLLSALQENCFICSAFWSNLSQTSRSWWTDSLSLGAEKHTTFRLYTEEYCVGVFRLSISLSVANELMDSSNESRFYLISQEPDCQDISIPQLMEGSTESQTTFDHALKWYRTCRSEHKRCSIPERLSTSWRPTRLIDIGSCNEANWKLCILAGDDKEPYITLSYRWSTNADILLKQSNLQEFMQGCPIHGLPQTFQDTILVARKLSIRYVWIDALCIIQDSGSDWEREAPTMRHVYANSACNIAASASADQFSGLFHTRTARSILPATFNNGSPPTWTIYDKYYWDRHIQTGLLHTRGWVFQECLLAPRVLFFGSHQILWKCLSDAKCEGFPEGIPHYISHHSLDLLWDQLENYPLSVEKRRALRCSNEIHALWNHLVEKYSCCELTNVDDRLPAFAGIAKLFKEITDDRYIAGLWRSKILDQINWMVSQPRARRTTTMDCPSWSWASVDGPVKLLDLPSISRHLASLVDVSVTSSMDDEFGTICDAVLELKGVLINFLVKGNGTRERYLERHMLEGSLYPDHLDFSKDKEVPLYLFPLRTWRYMDRQVDSTTSIHVSGFVLQSHGEVYIRCGYFTTHSRRDIEALGLSISLTQLAEIRDVQHVQVRIR